MHVDKVDITEEIRGYAVEFSELMLNKGFNLDFTVVSLIQEIDKLVPIFQPTRTGNLPSKEKRELSSRLLAYIVITLCDNHNAKCFGSFDLDMGAGPHCYYLVIIFNKYICNISDGLGRTLDDQYDFKEYYEGLLERIENANS